MWESELPGPALKPALPLAEHTTWPCGASLLHLGEFPEAVVGVSAARSSEQACALVVFVTGK